MKTTPHVIGLCLAVLVGRAPLARATDIGSAPAEAALKAGHAHFEAREYERAAAQFGAAVKLAPDLSEAWFFKGRSHEVQVEVPPLFESEEEWKRTQATFAANRTSGIEAYRRFLDLEATRPGAKGRDFEFEAYRGLTRLYADTEGSEAKAVESAQAFNRKRPGKVEALNLLAVTYRRLGRGTEAQAAYRALVQAAPADSEVCGAVASFYAEKLWAGKSRFPLAVIEHERCIALKPKDPAPYCQLAAAYWNEAYRSVESETAINRLSDLGLTASDKGLALQADSYACLAYKGQLLEVKARVAATAPLRQRYRKEAREMQEAANEAQRRERERRP